MHRFCQNLALSANIGIKILNWKLWDFETLKFFATLTGTSHSRKLEPRSHSSFSKKTSTECVARNSKASENGAEHRRSPLVRRLFASLWSWQLSSLGSEWRIFFVYVTRRLNFQNDRVWSSTPDEILNEEGHRKLIKNLECAGVFVLFTARRMMWVTKPSGQNWNGDYFRKILTDSVIPFQDPRNAVDVTQVTFLHDKAPCMKALRTQTLLRENNVDFFGNDKWPGNSPDLNVCENLGSIMKNEVEKRMLSEAPATRFNWYKMEEHI